MMDYHSLRSNSYDKVVFTEEYLLLLNELRMKVDHIFAILEGAGLMGGDNGAGE